MLACKSMPKNRMTSAADVESVWTELRAMREVGGHGAAVGVRGVVEDEENIHLLIERCEGGDLFDKLLQKKRFSESEASSIILSLSSFLHFCHQRGVMHRDLKPENVMLTSAYSDTHVKVGDFGQATFFTPGVPQTVGAGSQYYIAPEVLKCSYGPEADVWSLGCILYILLSGIPPFYGETSKEVFVKINTGVFNLQTGPWKTISCEAKDLVRRMLCYNPKNRITPEEIQGHPWILKHCPRHLRESPPHSPSRLITPFTSKEKFNLNSNSVLDSQISDPDSLSSCESPEISPVFNGNRVQNNKNWPMYNRPNGNQSQINGTIAFPKVNNIMGLPPKSKSGKGTLVHMSHSFPMSKNRTQKSGNSPCQMLSDEKNRPGNRGYKKFSVPESRENAGNFKKSSSSEHLNWRNEKDNRSEPNFKSNSKNSEWGCRSASELIAAVAEKLRLEENLNNLVFSTDGLRNTSLDLELEGLFVKVEFDQQLQNFGIYFREKTEKTRI